MNMVCFGDVSGENKGCSYPAFWYCIAGQCSALRASS